MPRPGHMIYIVSYDIPDNRRRTRLAKLLEKFAVRVQYSVFEADLTPEQFRSMLQLALKEIDDHEDNLRIYRLCFSCVQNIARYGRQGLFEDYDQTGFVL